MGRVGEGVIALCRAYHLRFLYCFDAYVRATLGISTVIAYYLSRISDHAHLMLATRITPSQGCTYMVTFHPPYTGVRNKGRARD
jgi:hypothetical protein